MDMLILRAIEKRAVRMETARFVQYAAVNGKNGEERRSRN